jgi:hypothetical protein
MTELPPADLSLRVRDFHDQFLLSERAVAPPPGWRTWTAAGRSLIAHPSLPVVRLRTAHGEDAGFALGHLIDRHGAYVRDDLQLPAAGDVAGAHALETYIYSFGGRFVFIVLRPHFARLYLDPFGSLACVWSSERRRAASTPTLLVHDEPGHPVFRPGFRSDLRDRICQFYPAGLTCLADVHRVVPNHFLDLASWTMVRHHPVAHRGAGAADKEAVVATIHDVIRRHAAAVVRECGSAYIALTAGYDSRRVLACAREVADRIECFTLRAERQGFGARRDIDLRTAARVAALAGVRHHVAPMSGGETGFDYLLRVGFSGGAGKAVKFDVPPRRTLDLSRGWLTGHGGGLCNAKYALRAPKALPLGPEDVLALLRLPKGPGFAEEVDRWLAGLPDVPIGLVIDLAILEHQGGSWVSPHMYGTAPFRMTLLPVNHRDLIDALFGLPLECRTSGALTRDVFRRTWPALLDLPFNEYSGPERWVSRAQAAAGSAFASLRRRAAFARK